MEEARPADAGRPQGPKQVNPDRFHHAHPATAEQIASELEREISMRRQVYPGRVADGRMTQAEAARQIAIAAAWAEDLRRCTSPPGPLPTATHGFTWAERRAALTRELAFRARVFGRRVAEGAMTRADAAHRTACLEALAARYDDGLDWRASNGRRPNCLDRDPDGRIAWKEWQDQRAAVDLRNTPAKQGELSLG